MSGQATGWALRHGPASKWARSWFETPDRTAHAVLVAIADAANRDGEHAYPGTQAIMDGSGYGRSTVFRALQRLVEWGYLVVEREGRGRGRATVYGLPGVTDSEWTPTVVKGPAIGTVTASEKVPQRDVSTQEKVPLSAVAAAEKVPLSDPTPLIGTEKLEATVTPCRARSDDTGDARAANDDPEIGFDLFWNVWPKRHGRKIGRKDALAKWRRLPLDEKRTAYRAARHYAEASDRGEAGAMDAFRWLEKRRWEDWAEPVTPTARPSSQRTALSLVREIAERHGGVHAAV